MNTFRKILIKLRKIRGNKKYNLFIRTIKPKPDEIILDLGGGGRVNFFEKKYQYKKNIICLNINEEHLRLAKNKFNQINFIQADGCKLPFKDKSIDIIFSNATIEHVGNYEKQKQFAKEIIIVSKKWFIITPNKYFPLELHTLIPFFQFFPKSIQNFLKPKMNFSERIFLLDYKRFRRLFGDSEYLKFGMFDEFLVSCS